MILAIRQSLFWHVVASPSLFAHPGLYAVVTAAPMCNPRQDRLLSPEPAPKQTCARRRVWGWGGGLLCF